MNRIQWVAFLGTGLAAGVGFWFVVTFTLAAAGLYFYALHIASYVAVILWLKPSARSHLQNRATADRRRIDGELLRRRLDCCSRLSIHTTGLPPSNLIREANDGCAAAAERTLPERHSTPRPRGANAGRRSVP
ncbi:hypothetical protein JF780_06945 [Mycobacterium intracellulare]|uniref:hypothetical protein n=1 Tax=Mycobacterium TaxID=1763 RepID=UPI00111C22D2|nr:MULTISPECIES: hypothetical protein [Mycobacterium]MCA2272574.1 hypothetical protein [Mycobacterium intracellulare]MCA2324687.1 hypothetical protein [Mycobacterium intracellulare]